MDKYVEWLSGTRYDRESEKYGMFKVLEFVSENGKTKVPYFKIKFKDTSNVKEVSLSQIKSGKVIDMDLKKNNTKKKNKTKKKEEKVKRYQKKRFIMHFNKVPRLLSLDLSTYSTGYCVWVDGKIEKYGYIYQNKSIKFDTKRIKFMLDEVKVLMYKYNINVVAIEDVIFKFKPVLYSLSKLQGVICNYLYTRNTPYALIYVMEWKNYLDINKDSSWEGENNMPQSKEKTVTAIDKKFKLNLREEFKDYPRDLNEPSYYDVADAIGIGYLAINDRIRTD